MYLVRRRAVDGSVHYWNRSGAWFVDPAHATVFSDRSDALKTARYQLVAHREIARSRERRSGRRKQDWSPRHDAQARRQEIIDVDVVEIR